MKKTLGKCDRCGKPVIDGTARYTLGEPERYRHAECQDWRSAKEVFDEMKNKVDAIKIKLGKLK